jgi:hypothetical protein
MTASTCSPADAHDGAMKFLERVEEPEVGLQEIKISSCASGSMRQRVCRLEQLRADSMQAYLVCFPVYLCFYRICGGIY